jgi:hypothetical protein
MAYHIDALKHAVKAPSTQTTLDCAKTEADSEQLRPRNHAVLAVRQGGDRGVRTASLQFPVYMNGNCTLGVHAPILARRMCRGARGM